MKLLQMEKKENKRINLDKIVEDVDKVFNPSNEQSESVKVAHKKFNDTQDLNISIKKADKNFNEIIRN